MIFIFSFYDRLLMRFALIINFGCTYAVISYEYSALQFVKHEEEETELLVCIELKSHSK